jgi:hypothetical protein
MRERAIVYKAGCPLIFQNIYLPELAPFLVERLLRLRRAGPSASLDKSADQGYFVVAGKSRPFKTIECGGIISQAREKVKL